MTWPLSRRSDAGPHRYKAGSHGSVLWFGRVTWRLGDPSPHAFVCRSALAHKQDDVVERGIRAVMEYQAGIEKPLIVPDAWLEVTETDLSLSYLEAMMFSFENFVHVDMTEFEERVNEVFNDYRIAFRFVERRAVPLTSDELHAEVVEPTLRLLIDTRFETAHDAYLKALEEIANNDPGDAITDAATALQETLVAMGCKGNALGSLWKDARKSGLVVGHDQNLLDGISKFVDWASADRSTTGDAHKHRDASLDDAWLMVHVVGAIIVRLAGKPRAVPATA